MIFCVETLGCKVNQYESQAIEAALAARGHTAAAPGEMCDAYIINTCCVTSESGRKSRQAARRLIREHAGAIIAVCGCFSQIDPEAAAALGADIVAGSGDRLGLVDGIERAYAARRAGKGGPPEVDVDDPRLRREFERLPAGGADGGRTRALLKIQDGCDNYCAYCVIPFARGHSRSLPPGEAAEEAARLRSAGFREIVITGIEISSYGADAAGGYALTDAVGAIAAAARGARLRLGSLHPGAVDVGFAQALAAIPGVCPHFHLSLQSGCDATLRRMERRYTAERAYGAVLALRAAFPGCGVTADLIAGFPGETDAEFAKTLEFIDRCEFSRMHVFPFSPRPGTAAAEMPGQLDAAAKRERTEAARERARRLAREFARRNVGLAADVLFESSAGGVSSGYAGNYLRVSVRGEGLRNQLLRVAITGARGEGAWGEMADNGCNFSY
jgi:threonylcarbamoyladenosine tRNA methylthiotransferase MtaB